MQVLQSRKKNDDFFGRFEEAAQNNLEAARLLDRLFADFTDPAHRVEQLHELEHKGDEVAHDVYRKLNTVFMPPLDREDIIALTRALDDVMDHIYEAADAMCIYNIVAPTPVARALATVIVACASRSRSRFPTCGIVGPCGRSRRASSSCIGSRTRRIACCGKASWSCSTIRTKPPR
jgi:uncharacterized protein Yka (UPF0111/DUF47 family)